MIHLSFWVMYVYMHIRRKIGLLIAVSIPGQETVCFHKPYICYAAWGYYRQFIETLGAQLHCKHPVMLENKKVYMYSCANHMTTMVTGHSGMSKHIHWDHDAQADVWSCKTSLQLSRPGQVHSVVWDWYVPCNKLTNFFPACLLEAMTHELNSPILAAIVL